MAVSKAKFNRLWNAFMNKDPTYEFRNIGPAYSERPDRQKLTYGSEKSIVNTIYNRIAIDVAAVDIRHVKLDENGRYLETINSGMNKCLSLSSNIDQTGRAFIQDVVMSMFDEGSIAIAPILAGDSDPKTSKNYDIENWRVGKIINWYPQSVKVRLYDERDGQHKDLIYNKESIAIVENPLYSIMNEPNSALKRLVRKLNLLDVVDEKNGSSRLDLIIQLPYVVKSESKRNQANMRRKEIERQLADTKYGIAYTDGTEKITQLNRSIENQLFKSVEYYTDILYNQLGLTKDIFEGSAKEEVMLNYNNRTIEPILSAIVGELKRKFISEEGIENGESVEFFKDPFKLVPVSQIAEIADKFTRNEIVSPNEIRQAIGMKPSKDPAADELRNRNISESKEEIESKLNPDNKESKNQNE